MEGVTNTLNSVQAVLLTQLKPNSILIGHSLESDLIALRVKHDYVVDSKLLKQNTGKYANLYIV